MQHQNNRDQKGTTAEHEQQNETEGLFDGGSPPGVWYTGSMQQKSSVSTARLKL
jgi:hypothetical protein